MIYQAFLKKEIIELSKIPDNYSHINSGLGNTSPKFIKLIPIISNDTCLGVIEIGFLSAPNPSHTVLIQSISELLAISIKNYLVNEKTERFLYESQMQTQQLSAQEEELRQNLEEMNSIQEEMERVNKDILLQNKIIDQIAIISKTDTLGNITYENDQFCEWSKYSREELIGKNHRILKSGDQSDTLFENLWKTLSQGKIWRGEIKNKAKDGSFYWVDSIIAPMMDENGRTTGYIAHRFVMNKKIESEMTKPKDRISYSKK